MVAVRPFRDADESLLARGGKKYRLENPDQILMRLKVENSGLGTLNNQMFGPMFVEEVANPYESKLKCLTQYYILYIKGK